jgi:hypothetical protein
MPTPAHLETLLEYGLSALREKIITPKQASDMPTADHLYVLLRHDGIQLLKEKFITVEQVASMLNICDVVDLIENTRADVPSTFIGY